MANKFEIQVVALDRFTQVFRKLNNNASKAVRPLTMTGRQLGALARETHMDKALEGINRITRASVVMSRTLGVSLGPLESLLGLGAAGGIVGGLGAAAVAAASLGVHAGRVGYEIARTSSLLDMDEKQLQRWRGAAKLAGGDADSMTATLFAMRNTMQEAFNNRDPSALAMLDKLGFKFKRTATGAWDLDDAMTQISRAMQKLDPARRAVLAEWLHLPPESIWVLQQGPEALQKFMNKAEALGIVMGGEATKGARTFTDSLNELKASVEGLALSWGNKLLPSMTKGIDAITHGINTGGLAGGAGNALARTPGLGPIPQGIRMWGRVISGLGSPNDLGPDSRTVSGAIGGPLHAGSLLNEDLARARSGVGSLSPSDAAMRAAVQMTPEELARAKQQDESAENIAELRREIARTPPGRPGEVDRRATLQDELHRIELQINLGGNVPAGTTASATSSSGAEVSTRVQHSMPFGISP